MLSTIISIFTTSLTLCFRHILTCSRLIQPCIFLLRHFKNPNIFRNILLQPYSNIFCTLRTVFRQIQGYLEPQLIKARYVSGIFSHIGTYGSIFAHIRVYFGKFRHTQNLGTVRHIHVY